MNLWRAYAQSDPVNKADNNGHSIPTDTERDGGDADNSENVGQNEKEFGTAIIDDPERLLMDGRSKSNQKVLVADKVEHSQQQIEKSVESVKSFALGIQIRRLVNKPMKELASHARRTLEFAVPDRSQPVPFRRTQTICQPARKLRVRQREHPWPQLRRGKCLGIRNLLSRCLRLLLPSRTSGSDCRAQCTGCRLRRHVLGMTVHRSMCHRLRKEFPV
ncbi:hypothetical protein GC173_09390 [bacterium]|nr:hypothetical protein [bacterium]